MLNRAAISALMFSSLYGCAPAEVSVVERLSLGEFESYVHEFETITSELGRPIQVRSLEVVMVEALPTDHEAGHCTTSAVTVPRIEILRSEWESKTETGRQVLMLHELGHCILGRSHIEDYMPVDYTWMNVTHTRLQPKSIMKSSSVPDLEFEYKRDYYLRELILGEAL